MGTLISLINEEISEIISFFMHILWKNTLRTNWNQEPGIKEIYHESAL